jgi:hypothetical protein
MKDEYVSLREAARLLTERGTPVSYWSLWNKATVGAVPARKVAGRLVLHESDLPKVVEAFTPAGQ